ncbi:MAG: hypothetical protein AVDCRST_MAG78-1635, partial [uncultured Rubrobacteraceae bacterium]
EREVRKDEGFGHELDQRFDRLARGPGDQPDTERHRWHDRSRDLLGSGVRRRRGGRNFGAHWGFVDAVLGLPYRRLHRRPDGQPRREQARPFGGAAGPDHHVDPDPPGRRSGIQPSRQLARRDAPRRSVGDHPTRPGHRPDARGRHRPASPVRRGGPRRLLGSQDRPRAPI